MAVDFVVKYDPEKETTVDISRKIIKSVFIGRIKRKKPCIIFISGDSGEGKSYTALRLEEEILNQQGVNFKNHVDDVNVYTPIQYPQKIKKILEDKKLKKVNVICMHEAREIIRSKLWHSFLTQAVGDINAMSRSIKRLCIIINSQFIRDITPDIRYTINFYCKVYRPKGRKARLYIYAMWKDDRDIDNPKIKRRKLSGYLVYPNGKYRRIYPDYLELYKPDKEITEQFEKQDLASKKLILARKINKLITQMENEVGINSKLDAMVDYYATPQRLSTIGRRVRGKWVMKSTFKEMHNLSGEEVEEFKRLLNEKFLKEGYNDNAENDIKT